jgi:preprotein translocase subunit SecG
MLLNAILVFVHVMVSVILILVVLLQTGKRADLAGAFGGGGSQTAFGPRGAATILSRATTVAAVVFMLTSLTLAYRMGIPDDASVVGDTPAAETPVAPLGGEPTPVPGGVPGTEPDPLAPDRPTAPTAPPTTEGDGAGGANSGDDDGGS